MPLWRGILCLEQSTLASEMSLKRTIYLRVDDVWMLSGMFTRITYINRCHETGVCHLETSTSTDGKTWVPHLAIEQATFLHGALYRAGRVVRTPRRFLGIRLPDKVAFVRD